MSQLAQLSPKEKAQTGMILIKTAIGEILSENKDRWLGRNQIDGIVGPLVRVRQRNLRCCGLHVPR